MSQILQEWVLYFVGVVLLLLLLQNPAIASEAIYAFPSAIVATSAAGSRDRVEALVCAALVLFWVIGFAAILGLF